MKFTGYPAPAGTLLCRFLVAWGRALPAGALILCGLLVALIAAAALIGSRLPDEGQMAFLWWREGNAEIYLLDVRSGLTFNLTRNPTSDAGISWSPDGQHIAFQSDRDGSSEIYVMDASGGNVRRLTHDEFGDSWPSWSPDGSRIAWVAWQGQGHGDVSEADIYSTDASCATLPEGYDEVMRNLTNAPDFVNTSPTWSPDGRWIAFCSRRDENDDIYLMSADGENVRRLTYAAGVDDSPTWSPDGRWIAFRHLEPSTGHIYLIDPTCVDLPGGCAGLERRLVDGPGGEYLFAWSPDGARIVFVSDRSGLRPLIPGDVWGANFPVWRPQR